MPALPLVWGSSAHISSWALSPPEPVDDYGDNKHTVLVRPEVSATTAEPPKTAVVTTDTWQIVASWYIYPRYVVDQDRHDDDETTTAEPPDGSPTENQSSQKTVHSRIAECRFVVHPLGAAWTRSRRETHFRLILPAVALGHNTETDSDTLLVASRDGRFLVWRSGQGDLAVFQLRRPRADSTTTMASAVASLSTPSYVTMPDTSPTITPPVVTQPKVVAAPTTSFTPTAICAGYGDSHFLVGTDRGTVFVLDGRRARYVTNGDNGDATPRIFASLPASIIVQLAWQPVNDDATHMEVSDRGLLAVLDAHAQVHVKNSNNLIALRTAEAVHALSWVESGATQTFLVTLSQSANAVTATLWYDNGQHQYLPCRSHVWRPDDLSQFKRTNSIASPPSIFVHAASDSVVVKASFSSTGTATNGSSSSSTPMHQPFVGIWSWRSHTVGWTYACPALTASLTETHLVVVNKSGHNKLRQYTYNIGWASPSSHLATRTLAVDWPRPLVMTTQSIWLPRLVKTQPPQSLSWHESAWPADVYGAPRVAALAQWSTIGDVTAAGDHGLCVWSPQAKSWKSFSSASAAERLTVQSLQWWESPNHDSSAALVVAVVQVDQASQYLAAWSPSRWEVHFQLIASGTDDDADQSTINWGQSIPSDGESTIALELLADGPTQKAVALLLCDDSTYRLYSLQYIEAMDPATGRQKIESCLLTVGLLDGPCQKTWLASAAFAENSPSCVATLGIWRPNNRIEAITVSSNGDTIAQACVSNAIGGNGSSIVMEVWLADRSADFLSWTLVLSNGRLVTWKLPFMRDLTTSPLGPEVPATRHVCWVHPSCRYMGLVGSTESTSTWMMPGSRVASAEVCLGTFAGGRFTFTLAVGQSVRPMHRVLGEPLPGVEHGLRDFLRNDIYGPGDLILLPPLLVCPLYLSILCDPEGVEDYLGFPIINARDRTVLALALRLLVLTAVDQIATHKVHSERAREARLVFQTSVQLARQTFGKDSLEFCHFIVELARQMEPSRFDYFLPLPPPGNESIGRILEITSSQGSIRLSLAALPLLSDKGQARIVCAGMFRLCLSACMKPQSVHHSVRREASEALGDLFRFGLKLETTAENGEMAHFPHESLDTLPCDDDSSSEDESGNSQRLQYSMFCGISRIFAAKTKVPKRKPIGPNSFVDDGTRGKGATLDMGALGVTLKDDFPQGVTEVVSHMLRALLLDFSHATLWGSTGRMATLLLPESLAGLHLATKEECTATLRDTSVRAIRHVLPKEFRRKNGLVDFFALSISRCMDCLDDFEILRVVDLVQVVLKHRPIYSEDQAEQRATLLLVLVVVGHISGKIDNLIESDTEHLILRSYYKAIEGPAEEPKSPRLSESSSSDGEISQ